MKCPLLSIGIINLTPRRMEDFIDCLEEECAWYNKELLACKLRGVDLKEMIPPKQNLTPTERKILERIGSGMSNKEISAALGINDHTVKNHNTNIYRKLNVKNRTQAARAFYRLT